MSTAVALLTRLRTPADVPAGVSRSDLLDGPAEPVLAAMEVLAGAFLELLAPGDRGPLLLAEIGLHAAAQAAQQPAEDRAPRPQPHTILKESKCRSGHHSLRRSSRRGLG